MNISANNQTEKKKELYIKQCETLKTVYRHGAITRAQYDKSFRDLTAKMGMEEFATPFLDPDAK